ncbi:kinase-like protein [Acrodontium crateriforme]|uniref:non-specific serine/threonine protein kinase n=1 Tax=Acrodontium crateriforme TaxID=150365 RepID=A0AAQ3M6D0_9PEZI|nr:kinase-like protein [Acrodontium crateriforme]
MSRRSMSRSDGEFSGGDEEKAISTNANSKRNNEVNTSFRHTSSSQTSQQTTRQKGDISRDKNFHFRDDDGPSSNRSNNRSRSRSPYRAPNHASGEKRKADEDHYTTQANSDPRRFKVHYEENASSRADYKRNETRNGRAHHVHGHDRPRSRSPFRRAVPDVQNGLSAHDQASDSSATHREPRQSMASCSERELTPQISHPDTNAKIKVSTSQKTQTDQQPEVSNDAEDEEPPKQLSEAEIIEQRRKKREAIKAKHKAQPDLRVQTLEQTLHSAPSTPAYDSSARVSGPQSPSSSTGSPKTSYRDSPPASPASFTVENDDELANHHRPVGAVDDDDGPSAADYDPNMDMEEDRPDHKRSEIKDTITVDLADSGLGERTTANDDEFDMFAENDDDDDMFAPNDMAKPAKSTKHAQTLDQSLLDNWDYPDGHYRIILGELLDGRYAVQQQVGKGTFATVVRAQDTKTGQFVAVKIACNNETMYKAGEKEMDTLKILNESDPDDKKHIIRLERDFVHKGHICLVFENLNADLREVLKKFGRNVGINIKAIRSYAQQMFIALSHMKKCEILHADLKPDNILINDKRNLLKICDLGTAVFSRDAEIVPYLVSRFYRAPEIILGMPFDYAIDMWSIGCTLFELYTGRILFTGGNNNQMLRVIQECRGKFPLRMLKRSTLADQHFDVEANFFSHDTDKITGKRVLRPVNLSKPLPGKDLKARLHHNTQGLSPAELTEHMAFVDLIEKCLQVDPQRRITANDALRHHFIYHPAPAARSSTTKTLPTLGVPRMK